MKTYSFGKTRRFAPLPCHPPGPPPLSGSGGVVPNSDRVTSNPQVAPLWVLPGQGCTSSHGAVLRDRKPGTRESLRVVREHRGHFCDFPGTQASGLKTVAGRWEPIAARGSERGRSDRGTGRGGMVAGGADRPGAPDSAAPARPRILSGSAQPALSCQVRAPWALGGTPGTAGLRARKGRDGDACGERWLPRASRLTKTDHRGTRRDFPTSAPR